jgi:hypothetical protein
MRPLSGASIFASAVQLRRLAPSFFAVALARAAHPAILLVVLRYNRAPQIQSIHTALIRCQHGQ